MPARDFGGVVQFPAHRVKESTAAKLAKPVGDPLVSCIYVIQAGEDGPVKIGIAADPKKRLRDLQVAHHETLFLRAVFGCTSPRLLEREVQAVLEARNLSGEWFKITVDEAIREVREMADFYDLPLDEDFEPGQSSAAKTEHINIRLTPADKALAEAVAAADARSVASMMVTLVRHEAARRGIKAT